ncbi:MAG: hypothetical protein LQ338_001342 [Usnochroma carphineum]|nr:MAG: hypothetical protein LQ338_001342 [Usnochroma carphineum]
MPESADTVVLRNEASAGIDPTMMAIYPSTMLPAYLRITPIEVVRMEIQFEAKDFGQKARHNPAGSKLAGLHAVPTTTDCTYKNAVPNKRQTPSFFVCGN